MGNVLRFVSFQVFLLFIMTSLMTFSISSVFSALVTLLIVWQYVFIIINEMIMVFFCSCCFLKLRKMSTKIFCVDPHSEDLADDGFILYKNILLFFFLFYSYVEIGNVARRKIMRPVSPSLMP